MPNNHYIQNNFPCRICGHEQSTNNCANICAKLDILWLNALKDTMREDMHLSENDIKKALEEEFQNMKRKESIHVHFLRNFHSYGPLPCHIKFL